MTVPELLCELTDWLAELCPGPANAAEGARAKAASKGMSFMISDGSGSGLDQLENTEVSEKVELEPPAKLLLEPPR